MSEYSLFTSESVSEGHPDKIADQISDAVLDAIIAQDKHARVAVETLVKTGVAIVAGGGEEILTSVSTLLAQCSKVGGNLNQLARHFNSGGADTEQLRAKLLDELADLTAFRLSAEKVLGELYGNAQAYRL